MDSGQQYPQYGGPQQQQNVQQPHNAPAPAKSVQRQPISAAQRQSDLPAPSGPAPVPVDSPKVSTQGGAKILTIAADVAIPKAKVLSIGVPSPTTAKEDQKTATTKEAATTEVQNESTAKAEAGAKATATKAIEKTGTVSSSTPSGRSSPSGPATKAATRDAIAVEVEQEADVDEETLKDIYGKEHVNIIFIGHVDAGKSTLGGSILYTTGMIDQRTLDKFKREAKEMGRETWYLSFALDLTDEERSKGKTVEVGRGYFETAKRRYSILDAVSRTGQAPSVYVQPEWPRSNMNDAMCRLAWAQNVRSAHDWRSFPSRRRHPCHQCAQGRIRNWV